MKKAGIVPLGLRSELFALFLRALERPELAPAFDWLSAFAALERPRLARGELAAHGETERGLEPQGLRTLLETGLVLRASASEAWVEAVGVAYLADRAPRHGLAVREIRSRLGRRPPLRRLEREIHAGQVLFNSGLFFDCHEYLEPAWRDAAEPERRMLQGLIQAAAGFHKLELGSGTGCASLLEVAAAKLAASPPPWREALLRFGASLLRCAPSARAGRLEPGDAPKLDLVR